MGVLHHKKQSLHVCIMERAYAFTHKHFPFSPGTLNYFYSGQITHPKKKSHFRINYKCFRLLNINTKQCKILTYTSFSFLILVKKNMSTGKKVFLRHTANKSKNGILGPLHSCTAWMHSVGKANRMYVQA